MCVACLRFYVCCVACLCVFVAIVVLFAFFCCCSYFVCVCLLLCSCAPLFFVVCLRCLFRCVFSLFYYGLWIVFVVPWLRFCARVLCVMLSPFLFVFIRLVRFVVLCFCFRCCFCFCFFLSYPLLLPVHFVNCFCFCLFIGVFVVESFIVVWLFLLLFIFFAFS